MTAYDRSTHSLIRGLAHASRSSLTPGIQRNPDSSVEVFFGPECPLGKAANWVPTKTGRTFEICVRFYGPQPSLYDRSWRLPDPIAISP
jgi:hypothetical protein